MFDVILLAIALSMDAFAVSIGLGSKPSLKLKKIALMAALYFGVFQGLMPLIGYFGGKNILGGMTDYAKWISFILLFFIGAKMLYEALSDNAEAEAKNITHRMMLVLAIATSLDAMAAGFALTVLKVEPLIACAIIAIITCAFSYLGVFVGAKSGEKFGQKAELFGGIVLICIGIKIIMV